MVPASIHGQMGAGFHSEVKAHAAISGFRFRVLPGPEPASKPDHGHGRGKPRPHQIFWGIPPGNQTLAFQRRGFGGTEKEFDSIGKSILGDQSPNGNQTLNKHQGHTSGRIRTC